MSDRLWISTRRTPLSTQAAWQAISVTTARQHGIAINPHLFRDCAATSIAIDDPAHTEIVARILGHRTLKAGQRHYIRARMIEAFGEYGDILRKRREGRRRALAGAADGEARTERLAASYPPLSLDQEA